MNKVHWNTVFVDGDVPEEEIKKMIERSYDIIKPKKRNRRVNK
jgi:predicted DNA-binding protein (MmcQ/YjbR family)